MRLINDVRPIHSVYFYGYIVLKELIKNGSKRIDELYATIEKTHKFSFCMYMYSLDWLFCVGVVRMNDMEEIEHVS